MTIEISSYEQFSHHLKHEGIALSAAELHGLLAGLIVAGVSDDKWLSLVYQFTNDDQAYPSYLLAETKQLYQDIYQQLADIDGFNFDLWLPEVDNVFERADAVSGWVNHFLLGLGLANPTFEKALSPHDMQEAFVDLRDIGLLGYDNDDDQEELSNALEEVIEYIRTIVTLFFTHFDQLKPESPAPKVLH